MAGQHTSLNAHKAPYIASQMIPRLLLASIISSVLSTSHAISHLGLLTPWTLVAGISMIHSSILLISAKLGYLAPLHFTPPCVASQKPKPSLWSLSSWSMPVVIPLPLLITTWFISICWFTVVALSPVWALFAQAPASGSGSGSWVSGWLARREHPTSFFGSSSPSAASGARQGAAVTTEMSWVLSFVGMVFAGLVQTVLHFWVFLLGVQVLVREEEEGKGDANGGSARGLEEGRHWGWDLDYAYSAAPNGEDGEEVGEGVQVDPLWLLAEQSQQQQQQQQWPKELEVGDVHVEVIEPQEAGGVILFSIPESEFESDDDE